jgi:beta-glucanase (GH16 family)
MNMKKAMIGLLASFVMTCFMGHNVNGQSKTEQWKLVWSDEFDGQGLPDSTKWGYDIGGHGWGNNELQYYTAKRTQNARVGGGILTIEAHQEQIEGKDFSSARLVTREKAAWSEGKIEVRAKLPSGVGTWPAIWMLSSKMPLRWPEDGEIDIMEHVGFDHGVVHGTIHTKKYNHIIGTQKANQIKVPDCAEQFHTYQVEWNKDILKIGMDGLYYFTYPNEQSGTDAWPFDNKMYLILNLAVGGNWGGQKGVDKSIWPRKMEVDFVRVYQH